MEEMLSYIANNGFAIAVAAYMIVYNTKIVNENTAVMRRMCTLIETFIEGKGGEK